MATACAWQSQPTAIWYVDDPMSDPLRGMRTGTRSRTGLGDQESGAPDQVGEREHGHKLHPRAREGVSPQLDLRQWGGGIPALP
jgi:hypothetical protein